MEAGLSKDKDPLTCSVALLNTLFLWSLDKTSLQHIISVVPFAAEGDQSAVLILVMPFRGSWTCPGQGDPSNYKGKGLKILGGFIIKISVFYFSVFFSTWARVLVPVGHNSGQEVAADLSVPRGEMVS